MLIWSRADGIPIRQMRILDSEHLKISLSDRYVHEVHSFPCLRSDRMVDNEDTDFRFKWLKILFCQYQKQGLSTKDAEFCLKCAKF